MRANPSLCAKTFSLGISKLKELPQPTVTSDDGSNLVWFSAGNPSVQQFEGHLRIAVNSDIPAGTSLASAAKDADGAPIHRGTQLCVLAVPRYMSISDFYRFLGDAMDHVMHLRIVHSENPERYMALCDLDSEERCPFAPHTLNPKPQTLNPKP